MQTVDDLKVEIERLKVIINEQREMLKNDIAREMFPVVQELVQTETKRALASKTLEIAMNPGFLKDYYNQISFADRKEYLDALDFANLEVQKVLEVAPNFREKIFKLRGFFEVLENSKVKMACSATELSQHNFNELKESIGMLPKVIIPEPKKESQYSPSQSKRPFDPNYRRNDSTYTKQPKY